MAKKFFRQKVHNKKRTITQVIIISVCVIGIISCLLLVHYYNSKLPEGAVATIRDSVTVEVNSKLPNKTAFFSELKNVDAKNISVDYKKIDIKQTGEYEIKLKVFKKKYKSTLKIVDTISPELTVKDVTIAKGTKYRAEDFVASCSDNSKIECHVEFYQLATTQDGGKIDYAKFEEEGTYTVQIIATDDFGNKTAPMEATLVIGEGSEMPKPVKCNFGNTDYDNEKYILAVSVGENNCAIDPDLYNNETILAAINTFTNDELAKIKNEFNKLNIRGTVNVYPNQIPIPNKTGEGLVGYALEMVLKNGDGTELEHYFVRSDGSRVYSVNKYNLK